MSLIYEIGEDDETLDTKKRKSHIKIISKFRRNLRNVLKNKYFEIFMNSGKFPELEDEQNYFANYMFWSVGGFAVWKIKHLDEIGLAPFSVSGWYNRYLTPTKIQLTQISGSYDPTIPKKMLNVNQDAVIIWYSPNHQPVQRIVMSYVDRIVQVEMIINANLTAQKMPFLVKANSDNVAKLNDLIKRILNDELVITTDVEGAANLEVLQTATPLIIADLYNYRKELENELLTYLGFNTIPIEKKERLITDEAQANDDYIEASDDCHTDEIKRGCERVKKYLNYTLTYKSKFDELQSRKEKETKEDGGDQDVDVSNNRE